MSKYLKVNLYGTEKLSKIPIHNLVRALKTNLKLNITSIIINFVTESEIIEINEKFLNHRFPTDIITFDYAENGHSIDGELFICYKEAELNSRKYRVKIEEELTRLIIHGILHLIGYTDKVKSDRLVMKRIENKLLKKFKYVMLK